MKTYILILLAACLFTSCLKNKDGILDYRGIEPVVLNPKSNFPSKGFFPMPVTDSIFGVTTLNLVAKYSFQKPAPKDIKVTFQRDDAILAQYNATMGTDYLPLPTDAYEMTTTQATISSGMQTGILPVKIIPAKISGSKDYFIAFTITQAEGITIAENQKTMIYTLKGR